MPVSREFVSRLSMFAPSMSDSQSLLVSVSCLLFAVIVISDDDDDDVQQQAAAATEGRQAIV